MINPESLKHIFAAAASAKTSASPEVWTPENPTHGHCAVVALIIQDMFGGELLRASLEGTEFAESGSHYWNVLPDGTEIDATEDQFLGRKPALHGEERSREYVLSYAPTRERYEQLKLTVLRLLADGVQE